MRPGAVPGEGRLTFQDVHPFERRRLWLRLAAGRVSATAGLVLVGWIFDIGVLKSVLARWPTMKPNTALSFMLTAGPWFMPRHPGTEARLTVEVDHVPSS